MADRYSVEIRKKILDELSTGKSIASVSKEYGIHPTTISKWKRVGVEPRQGGRPSTVKEKKVLEKLSFKEKKELFKTLFKSASLGNQAMALNLVRNWGLDAGINYLSLVLNPKYLTKSQTKLTNAIGTENNTQSFEEE